ncbi:hypothetical protein Vretifemale_3722 [Volvox reticuliferus]|nr:hypothetical protein Vretifemale_3722 [Volvox reticuliferus]
MSIPPFHIAFPVHDIQAARDFYGGVLGCPEGRSAASWVDFNLYGHQSATLSGGTTPLPATTRWTETRCPCRTSEWPSARSSSTRWRRNSRYVTRAGSSHPRS